MIAKIREYSIPLILGVIVALIVANIAPEWYHHVVHTPIIGKEISFHWLINDIFMVLFFATAGIEIVNSFLPGGPLNPPKKAVTPLMATAGGVIFPAVIFVVFNTLFGDPAYSSGWGIGTATDIALAWLVASFVFGKKHPAVTFLLLLAVADDGIGLIIIAVFYPDPAHPVEPMWLLLVVLAMAIAFVLNKKGVQAIWPYFLVCGVISWFGMHNAHLHAALSLVFIVPFMPHKGPAEEHTDTHGLVDSPGRSTLGRFEDGLSPIVDFGLFFFGFTNAGVQFSVMSELTLIVLLALVLGKTLGISLMATVSEKVLKFPLPTGMQHKDVLVAGVVGGMGLTVALFITESAFIDMSLQGAAKMGALFSVIAAPAAIILGKILRVEKKK